ncbi:Peroxisomal membrane signal receptor PTS1 [Quaeritorhiza haematococci]|nr:Peroxisomal membrane signal receptor PTS1 [Quaeritorhiza haematococci]
MSALADLVGSGSECVGGNSLTQLTKQMGQDRSAQQDRFLPDAGVGSSSSAVRILSKMPSYSGLRLGQEALHLAEEFLRDAPHALHPGQRIHDTFNFNQLGKELENMGPSVLPTGPVGNWAEDFLGQGPQLRQGQPLRGPMEDPHLATFEHVFQQHQTPAPSRNWADEFATKQHLEPHHPISEMELENAFAAAKKDVHFEQVFSDAHNAELEAAFEKAKGGDWANEFGPNNQSWADEFKSAQDEVVEGADAKEALSRTAGRLLDIIDRSSNPKFKQSKFLDFMKKLHKQEVAIEGNKVVEQKAPVASQGASSWAAEFGAAAGVGVKASNWEEDFMAEDGVNVGAIHHQHQQVPNSNAPMWAEEFTSAKESEWAQEFRGNGALLDDESQRWVEDFKTKMGVSTPQDSQYGPLDDQWESMEEQWRNSMGGYSSLYRATDLRYDNYEFTADNPFLSIPVETLSEALIPPSSTSHAPNLAESILALEALVQKQPENANAWYTLGIRQQENENEAASIAALRQSVKLDPNITNSWIALAVSYTNESAREDAYDALEAWMAHSPQYKHIVEQDKASNPGTSGIAGGARHEQVSKWFLRAARESPGENLDPDVQIALGVLFNVSEEYSKAIDCFEAALSRRPQDYMVWNKLGATLANSGIPDNNARALDAYYNALEINPGYIRARYNLAIACIQMEQYREAAEHLVGALTIQEGAVSTLGGGLGEAMKGKGRRTESIASESVWRTLRMVMDGYLHRPELAAACDDRNLDAFKGEF